MIWNPEQYMPGSYFQNAVSDEFCKRFTTTLHGTILDIGCGDGKYSSILANQLEQCTILGIDSSAEMIHHANQHWTRDNLSFAVTRMEDFKEVELFDFILSFWCLHWTNIEVVFPNIFQALKNGGKVYAVFSSFSDNSILQTVHELAKQARYKELMKNHVNSGTNLKYFYKVVNILAKLPFKQVKLDLKITKTYLPDIDYFKNLLRTMPFMNAIAVADMETLIDDMSITLQTICQRKYGGKLYYETRPIFLEATK